MCPIHVINFNSQPSAHIYIEIDISYVDNLASERNREFRVPEFDHQY
jgi:hypothetical protein